MATAGADPAGESTAEAVSPPPSPEAIEAEVTATLRAELGPFSRQADEERVFEVPAGTCAIHGIYTTQPDMAIHAEGDEFLISPVEDAVVTVNHLVVGGGKDAAVERACLEAAKSALGWPWPGT